MDEKLYKIKSVMLGHAVADALGVPVEFCERDELREEPNDYVPLTEDDIKSSGYISHKPSPEINNAKHDAEEIVMNETIFH